MAGTTRNVKRIWSLFTQHDSSYEDALKAMYEEINNIVTDLETARKGVTEFTGSASWDPASIAGGALEAKDITVTGAALGDFVTAVSFDKDISDLVLTADVTAADTVTAVLANNTGGAVDLASGTIRVRVSSQGNAEAASDLVAADLSTAESGD